MIISPPETQYIFSKRLFNPLFYILLTAIQDPRIRYIFIYGGSSAAKTYSIAQVLTWLALQDGSSSMIMRKFSVDIEDSIWADFKEIGKIFQLDSVVKTVRRHIRFPKDTQIRFRGLDKSEKLKGLKGFKYLLYNELSLFDKPDLDEGSRRLRGMPGQKIIGDWNPISEQHWLKTEVIDKETWHDANEYMSVNAAGELVYNVPGMGKQPKYRFLDPEHSFVRLNAQGNMMLIKTTHLDNWWTVGRPDGKVGFRDQHAIDHFEKLRRDNPNDYRIYALGEWGRIRTGGEFLKSFNEGKHVKPLTYQDNNTIHVSLDNNVLPYVTNSIWQINTTERMISQIHEIPSESPDNNAPRAARQLARYLNKIRYAEPVYVYGDPSAQARSTIDEDNASFFDKYIAELKKCGYLVVNRVQKSAPRVAMSGAFLNEIFANGYDGWEIEVNVGCRESINDYCLTMEDKDGKVLKKRETDKKTGLTYEKHGHFTDALRYFICTILAREFKQFKSRNSKLYGVSA